MQRLNLIVMYEKGNIAVKHFKSLKLTEDEKNGTHLSDTFL